LRERGYNPVKQHHVLIVGGGPVGLSMAAGLAHLGIPSTVLEKDPEIVMFPKASTIHPPTLEIMEEWGLVDKLLEEGLKVHEIQYWDRPTKQMIAKFNLDLLKDETPYPFRLQLEQSVLQVILEKHFRNSDLVNIKFRHKLIAFKQDDRGVVARVETPDGVVEMEGDFLIGADGASSTVRKLIGIQYEGFTYERRFLTLGVVDHDFRQHYEGLGDVSYFFDPNEFVALIHNHLMWKIMLPLPEHITKTEDLTDAYIQERIRYFTGVDKTYNVVHKSVFNVHQRVAPRVFEGRVVLVGDSAHLNNPFGGMGMNSGIHDAYFLGKDIHRLLNDPDLSVRKTPETFQANRHAAIQEVQRRTIENEKAAAKKNESQIEKLKRYAADEKLAKQYLMQNCMIDDFNFMKSRNQAAG